MALFPTFSRRKRQAAGRPDIFRYSSWSVKLREQTVQIIAEANRKLSLGYGAHDINEELVKFLRRELGVPELNSAPRRDMEFYRWFHAHQVTDELLDAVEYASLLIMFYAERKPTENTIFEDFQSELNARFLEDSFGFQLNGRQIIQIDSTFAHSEITVPTLIILSDEKYKAAEEEFRKAHEEFKANEFEDCIHDCCNALESVLKTILTEKKWSFNPNDTMSKLLDIAFSNNLIPIYMQKEFTGLRTILESGTPTVRNKAGGHGAGTQPRNVPRYIAAFQLHQTAAAIILLVEASKS